MLTGPSIVIGPELAKLRMPPSVVVTFPTASPVTAEALKPPVPEPV